MVDASHYAEYIRWTTLVSYDGSGGWMKMLIMPLMSIQ
jgi:hypothetical protein